MKGCMMRADSTTFDPKMKEDILSVWMHAYQHVQPAVGQELMVKTECPFYDCGKSNMTMDFVVHLQKLDCVTHNVLIKLFKHASPRRVLLLAPDGVCAGFHKYWTKLASNSRVRCVDQSSVMPDITVQGISKWLTQRLISLPLGRNESRLDNRSIEALAHLYYDQLVKTGVAKASEKLGLSDDYVMWDSGLVLIRDFCPFSTDGKINLMGGAAPRSDVCMHEHEAHYRKLLGGKYKFSAHFSNG